MNIPIEVSDMAAGYGGVAVIRHLTFKAVRGEVVAITGGNAAGKSTFLRVLFGLLKPYSGVVTVGGLMGRNLQPYLLARRGGTYVPQNRNVFSSLTVAENMLVAVESSGKTIDRDFLEKVLARIAEFGIAHDRRAGILSGGQKQILAFARSIVVKPEFMLLDEPFAGVSGPAVDYLCEEISRLARAGATILVVDHRHDILSRIQTRRCLMERGEILAGAPSAL